MTRSYDLQLSFETLRRRRAIIQVSLRPAVPASELITSTVTDPDPASGARGQLEFSKFDLDSAGHY
jgi:hypothetical protein